MQGEGPHALVSVIYEDNEQVTFFQKHLLPSQQRDLVQLDTVLLEALESLNMMLGTRLSEIESTGFN